MHRNFYRFINFAAVMPYVAYGIYFGIVFYCDTYLPENCWLLRLLFLFIPSMELLWFAALILLLYACSSARPDQFPSVTLGVFLTSNLVWWPLRLGQGRFLEGLPIVLKKAKHWVAIPPPTISGNDGLAYAIFFVAMPLAAAFFGLALFLLLSVRPYQQKASTVTLFISALALIAVLHFSALGPLPFYLWSLFWLLPVGASLVYLRTGTRFPKID